MNLATIILAAGKGKRMKNPNKSKVMFEMNGKPLIQYVIDLSIRIRSDLIIPIVGHQKQSVIDFLTQRYKELFSGCDNRIKFATQDEQLGTGHAIMQAQEYLQNFNGDILILSGDVPLLKYETVNKFMNYHKANNFRASLISAIFENPYGYGRIIRDMDGTFTDIVEEKDTSVVQREIKEINSGIYMVDCNLLFEALKTIKTDNSQGEYYLTDIFEYFRDNGIRTGAIPVGNSIEITGVNTIEQLKELEKDEKLRTKNGSR